MERRFLLTAMLFLCLLILSTPAAASPIIFSASGPNTAAIQGTVDAFRATLGTLNPNNPGSLGSGRREINWDGVPDAASSPNAFPGNFFNGTTPGRARGAEFSTPGTGFQVSANAVNPTNTPIEFGNIDPSYPGLFTTFSPQKLFTALGSTVTDVNFFIPGSATPATVSGFGAVFTDVDLNNITQIQFFGQGNALLDSEFVPRSQGSETLSFLGVFFDQGERVSSVRITSGNAVLALGTTEPGPDLVVMDDFIYGEPVPLPGTFLLMGTGLAGFWLRRRFTKK